MFGGCAEENISSLAIPHIGEIRAAMIASACSADCCTNCSVMDAISAPSAVRAIFNEQDTRTQDDVWEAVLLLLVSESFIRRSSDGKTVRFSQTSMDLPWKCRIKLIVCEVFANNAVSIILFATTVALFTFNRKLENRKREMYNNALQLTTEIKELLTQEYEIDVDSDDIKTDMCEKYASIDVASLWEQVKKMLIDDKRFISRTGIDQHAGKEVWCFQQAFSDSDRRFTLHSNMRYSMRPSAGNLSPVFGQC
jgi:hypothetical protein